MENNHGWVPPTLDEDDQDDDPVRTARGIIHATCIMVGVWGVIGFAIAILWGWM